jgi:DUF971 family protein
MKTPLAAVLASLLTVQTALAQSPAPSSSSTAAPQTAPDDATERGRKAYLRGVQLSKDEQWGDALAAFQEAAAARDAPLVQFSIAYCERALAHYVAARRTLERVLANPAGLAATQIEEAKGYLAEFERVLVRVKVHLDPKGAAIAVDGRALLANDGEKGAYLGGIAPPGEGKPLDETDFVVVLDPGVHSFRAVRAGHRDVVLQKSYRPGEQAQLDMRLDVLPATIAIKSEPGASIVRVDKREVGLAPIEFERPAGKYSLEVVHDQYETYTATLDLAAGQRADMTARLTPYKEPLTKKWWFWTGAVAIIAGGAALTYALTRPTPQPPPYDAGNANWLVRAKSFAW